MSIVTGTIHIFFLLYRMCEIMFEKYGTAAVFIAKDSTLACYASGKTSGLVVDIGASGTVISPVQDGFIESKNVIRGIVGGRTMDSHLRTILENKMQSNYPSPRFLLKRSIDLKVPGRVAVSRDPSIRHVDASYQAFMNLELGREFREAVGRTADYDLDHTDARFINLPLIPFELPDGTVLDVGVQRFEQTELLMNPTPLRMPNVDIENFVSFNYATNSDLRMAPTVSMVHTSDGLPTLVQKCVKNCEPETHLTLYNNIILTGGAASVEGLGDRLKNELDRVVYFTNSSGRNRVLNSASTNLERVCGSWIGGSILGSMGSFHEMWISRKEFNEYGAGIIDKKCP